MTSSYTTTETWSRTHARRVGGKIVADLLQMQQAYESPSAALLEKYLQELVVLLDHGVINEITYGFQRNDQWIVAIRYAADMSGFLTADDRSGTVPRNVDTSGATWGSYLTYSAKWDRMSPSEKAAIQKELPFQRQSADAPTTSGVIRVNDKAYSAAGCGVRRSTIGGL